MSLAITHFAFGAATTALIVTLLFSASPSPLTAFTGTDVWDRIPSVPYPRTVVLLGGIWALLPDVQRIVPVGRSSLFDLHKSNWADLFWFHRTFDVVDSGDSELAAVLAVTFFVGVTALSEWWERRAVDDDRRE